MKKDGDYKSRSKISLISHQMTLDNNQKKKALLNQEERNYNAEIFEQGTEWALQEQDIEDAGELSNNINFVRGYARGLRLKFIEMTDNKGFRR